MINSSFRVLVISRQQLSAQCFACALESVDSVSQAEVTWASNLAIDAAARLRPRVCFFLVSGCADEWAVFRKIALDIRQQNPQCACAVVGGGCGSSLAREAMDHGFQGYLTRDLDVSGLPDAIMRLAQGKSVFSERLVVDPWSVGKPTLRWDALSEREIEVLRDVAEGLSSKQSADRLQISSKTVDTHRRRIQAKLAVETPAELTRIGMLEGLVSQESDLEQLQAQA